jgi:hypothetical protein
MKVHPNYVDRLLGPYWSNLVAIRKEQIRKIDELVAQYRKEEENKKNR